MLHLFQLLLRGAAGRHPVVLLDLSLSCMRVLISRQKYSIILLSAILLGSRLAQASFETLNSRACKQLCQVQTSIHIVHAAHDAQAGQTSHKQRCHILHGTCPGLIACSAELVTHWPFPKRCRALSYAALLHDLILLQAGGCQPKDHLAAVVLEVCASMVQNSRLQSMCGAQLDDAHQHWRHMLYS